MEKFNVLNKLNNFKQRVKILHVFQDEDSKNKFNVLVVTKDDKTFAFGENYYGQLGFGHDRVVYEIEIVSELCDQQIIDFANGRFHCIALNSSGKVFCWGFNSWGALGIGLKDPRHHKPKFNQYLNNEFVVDISCGEVHSLVLTNCGEVYAWGGNYCGQIGNGCNYDQLKPIKVNGFNNEKVVMISCGFGHSMALTECGHVYSWGWNSFGQLGIWNTEDSNEPKLVAVVDENDYNVFIEKISCGSCHSLLLSSDGNIYAFGRNEEGELGNQKEKDESSPQRIKIKTKFIDISSRWFLYDLNYFGFSIALSQNGFYYIWGKCREENIRTPNITNFESFFEIFAKYLGITQKAINFEEQNSVPILVRDENVYEVSKVMEKYDVSNKLNDEFKKRVKILYVFQNYEYEFPDLTDLKGYNVLIVTKDGKTYAFGENSCGQLGFGHNSVVNEIQIVEQLCDQQIIDFANGKYHCIARNSRGKVYCWGRNKWGLLGIGSEDDSYHKPILNQYLNSEFVIDISCGAQHSLVLTNCGEVYAWGRNDCGQIGNGCNDNQSKPIQVKCFNNERVEVIACGSGHSMALTERGHVYSWGRNDHGQLGVRNTKKSNKPKFVAVKRNVFIKKISCGSYHSLLLSSNGGIYAFGRNEDGELGNQKVGLIGFIKNRTSESSPQIIKKETKFIDISSHWNKYISIASQDGIYYIWGKCGEEIIRTPKRTNFQSFDGIYTKYFKITHKAINFEEQNSVELRDDLDSSEKVKANEYNSESSSNRFNSHLNETLSRYKSEFKELEFIGKGGFGVVRKVLNYLDQQHYAVKMIRLKGICK
jgi:alpha-tubulin suppressor-like RCC1 family protein